MKNTELKEKIRNICSRIDAITKGNVSLSRKPNECEEKTICRILIEKSIDGLKPLLDDASKTAAQFNDHPNIQTGTRKADARNKAIEALQNASDTLWNVWTSNFKDKVTKAEMVEMIDTTIGALINELYNN